MNLLSYPKIGLPHLRMLVFEGPQTRAFLQGQLSCDTVKLPVGAWVWGGYLTPKGRLLATFMTLAFAEDRIGLLMDKSLIPAVKTTLQRYLLRAKTKPKVDELLLWSAYLGASGLAAGSVDCAAEEINVGCAGMSLHASTTADINSEKVADWWAHCARAGMPWFTESLQEQLTVHHASLDLIGGVDFDKGCYIGQEIVIRAHHRGAIKKRLYVVVGEGRTPAAGAELTSPLHGGQVVGNILYAAALEAGFIAAASIRKDASEQLALAGSATVTATAPPYGLIDPKFEQA